VRQIIPAGLKKKLQHILLASTRASIDAVSFFRQGRAPNSMSATRPSWTALCRPLEKRWVFIRALSEAATIRARRTDPDAGARGAGVRETSTTTAEEIRSGGGRSSTATAIDRQPRHQAQRFDPLKIFPDNLIKATLATEDRRFYDHFGIDIAAPGARSSPTRRPAACARVVRRSPSSWRRPVLSNERTSSAR